MVYANKKEREKEKSVCDYIVKKVLNRSNLTKITGITTKGDLERDAEADRLLKKHIASREAERQEALQKKYESINYKMYGGDIENEEQAIIETNLSSLVQSPR